MAPEDLQETFDFQLIETTYRQRIEYDEGHGSAMNIVSDTSTRVMCTWTNRTKEFGDELVKYGDPSLRLQPNESDGRYDYSYRLERKASGDSDWNFVGHLENNRFDERDEDDREEYSSDPIEEDWPEQKCFCHDCGAEVAYPAWTCDACEEKWQEMQRPRCVACGNLVAEDGMLCKECSEEVARYERERLDMLLKFLIFDSGWRSFCWGEFKLWLKYDVLNRLKKRMRR